MLNANDLADWWMKPTLVDFCVMEGEKAFTVAKENKVVERTRMITNKSVYYGESSR